MNQGMPSALQPLHNATRKSTHDNKLYNPKYRLKTRIRLRHQVLRIKNGFLFSNIKELIRGRLEQVNNKIRPPAYRGTQIDVKKLQTQGQNSAFSVAISSEEVYEKVFNEDCWSKGVVLRASFEIFSARGKASQQIRPYATE
ncbi:hypothetical protein WA026_014849 [Henosepilachna vigintioctopunctata]|uniref:Uncharacterized protein n=1 Tax=Henosepilachna vigintioctopunctata TaxID=420089 RepID=A0AAW1UY44_9CUCU